MTDSKRASVAAFGAAIAAREALKNDAPSAFATALSRGIDLRDDVFGSTIWDLCLASRAHACFEQLLPHCDLIGGPHAEAAHELIAGANLVPSNMGFGPHPANAIMAEAARKELSRQEDQRQKLGSISERFALSSSIPKKMTPSRPKQSL